MELSYIFCKTFFLYLQKWNFPALRIKNFRKELSSSKNKKIYSEKVSYISGNGNI